MGSLLQKPIFWLMLLILITALFLSLTFFISNTRNKNQPLATKKPGSCLILEEKYCSQGKRTVINGNTYLVLALPSEVPVLAPKDGRVLDIVVESGVPFSGYKAILRLPDPPGGAYFIIGGLRFDTMPTVEMPQQKANPKNGSVIGYSTGGDIFITKTKRTPSGTVTDEELLKSLFRLR